MNPDVKANERKCRRALKIALAVLMTLAELFFAGVLYMAYKEMCHEGATYSQWYEGSIVSFYRSIVGFLMITPLFAVAWREVVFDLRGSRWTPAWLKKVKGEHAAGVFVGCMFLFIALMFAREDALKLLEFARAANEEAIEWRIRQIGRYEVLMLLAAQGYALSLSVMIGAYRADKRRRSMNAQKGPSGKKARRKALRQQNAAQQNASEKKN